MKIKAIKWFKRKDNDNYVGGHYPCNFVICKANSRWVVSTEAYFEIDRCKTLKEAQKRAQEWLECIIGFYVEIE